MTTHTTPKIHSFKCKMCERRYRAWSVDTWIARNRTDSPKGINTTYLWRKKEMDSLLALQEETPTELHEIPLWIRSEARHYCMECSYSSLFEWGSIYFTAPMWKKYFPRLAKWCQEANASVEAELNKE